MRALSLPISSACILKTSSRSRNIVRNISQRPSEVNGSFGSLGMAIAGFDRPLRTPSSNIVPFPSNIHEGLKLYKSHNSAIVSTPTFILPFRISENLAGFIPKLCAIPDLDSPLSCKRLSIAALKRRFISFLSIYGKNNPEILKNILMEYRNSVSLQRVPDGTSGQRYKKAAILTNLRL